MRLRKAAEAADSKSRHHVSARYQTTFDKQLFFFRLADKFLLFRPHNLILQSITLFLIFSPSETQLTTRLLTLRRKSWEKLCCVWCGKGVHCTPCTVDHLTYWVPMDSEQDGRHATHAAIFV